MIKKDVLELEIRRKIYNHIRNSPGLHERELARELNIALSTLDYHLYYIKQRGLIRSKQDGRYTRYYISGDVGIKEGKVLSVLRQKVTRRIIIFLLLNPNATHKEVTQHIGLARSTITFHLNKLTDLDIISQTPKGRQIEYQVTDSEYISDLIITYQTTFLDDSVDRFLTTWFFIHPHHQQKQKTRTR